MTCIIGIYNEHTKALISDTLTTAGNHKTLYANYSKIIEGKNFILGLCGVAAFNGKVRRHLEELDTLVKHEDLDGLAFKLEGLAIDYLDEESTRNWQGLLVCDTGLYEVEPYGAVYQIADPFYAIGSGYSVALGYMEAFKEHDVDTAIAAIEAAIKYDTSVGGKVEVVCLV